MAEGFWMDEIGEQPVALPKWAERGYIPPKVPRPTAWSRFRLPLGMLAAVVFAAVVGGAFVLGRETTKTATPSTTAIRVTTASVSPTTAATAVIPATTAIADTTVPATTVATTTTAASTTTTVASTTVASTTVASTTVASTVASATTAPPTTVPIEALAPRTAVYSQGKIYLAGAMPSQAVADVIINKAADVLGRANVVVEYVIDPRASLPNEGSLQVADTVLFESDSYTLTPESLPILNLGVVLMKQNPKITIDVIGHTDSEGTPESNVVLAHRRCDAVIAYLTAAGIEAERLVGIPKGATEPVADNANPEGRRLNRRAEFIVHGLLET
jgi:outer membrane protein OmpA-like peptidoglycan-associated protein